MPCTGTGACEQGRHPERCDCDNVIESLPLDITVAVVIVTIAIILSTLLETL